LGVDFGSAAIKVVQVANKGGQAVLESYGEVALGPYGGVEAGRAVSLPTDKMLEALNDLLREAKINATESAASIPLLSSLVTIFEVPSLSGVELDQVVGIELKKYIPVSLNEVAVDWQVLPSSLDNKMHLSSENADDSASFKDSPLLDKKEILAVAIHNDALNYIKDVVIRSGRSLKFFELESFSIARSSVSDYNSVLIADVGAGSTKLSIVEEGMIRTSHVVNFGSQDITLAISGALNVSIIEAEKLKREKGLEYVNHEVSSSAQNDVILPSLRYVVYEMKKLILEYEQKRKRVVKSIVLVGGGSALKGFADFVGDDTQIQTKVADPFAKLHTPAFMRDNLKKIGPSFAVATGLALRGLSENS
jgi:type IV pilus assembly protein PilM